jgi:lanosterol synthase
MERAYELVVFDDENTDYQCVGSVNKVFNFIVRAIVDGPDSDAYKQHKIKRQDFMWMGDKGMFMCGTNGSQLWDIALITQALVDTGLAAEEENRESLLKALEWIDNAQIRTDPKHYHTAYRHSTKGAWGFRYAVVF